LGSCGCADPPQHRTPGLTAMADILGPTTWDHTHMGHSPLCHHFLHMDHYYHILGLLTTSHFTYPFHIRYRLWFGLVKFLNLTGTTPWAGRGGCTHNPPLPIFFEFHPLMKWQSSCTFPSVHKNLALFIGLWCHGTHLNTNMLPVAWHDIHSNPFSMLLTWSSSVTTMHYSYSHVTSSMSLVQVASWAAVMPWDQEDLCLA
jgi:hypothetical protein